MSKQKIYGLGLLTLIGFPAIGITIVGFVEENPWAFKFGWQSNWVFPTLIGLAYGFGFGVVAWKIINTEFMRPIKMKYGYLIKNFRLNNFEIVFLSLSAGIGEEVLFRGVLQHYWGIWITAIVFVAIHGYLNPTDKRISLYGAIMTLAIAGMGYLTEYLGIASAMAAHFAIDVVLLYKLTHIKSPVFSIPQPSHFDFPEITVNPHSEDENEDEEASFSGSEQEEN